MPSSTHFPLRPTLCSIWSVSFPAQPLAPPITTKRSNSQQPRLVCSIPQPHQRILSSYSLFKVTTRLTATIPCPAPSCTLRSDYRPQHLTDSSTYAYKAPGAADPTAAIQQRRNRDGGTAGETQTAPHRMSSCKTVVPTHKGASGACSTAGTQAVAVAATAVAVAVAIHMGAVQQAAAIAVQQQTLQRLGSLQRLFLP